MVVLQDCRCRPECLWSGDPQQRSSISGWHGQKVLRMRFLRQVWQTDEKVTALKQVHNTWKYAPHCTAGMTEQRVGEARIEEGKLCKGRGRLQERSN